MARSVECLSCGLPRLVVGDAGECPRCRYVGWVPVELVTEELRRDVREVPVHARRPSNLSTRVPFAPHPAIQA